VIEYDFSATQSNSFVVSYYDVNGQAGQDVNTQTWSTQVIIPDTTKSANIFVSAAQDPPYTTNNVGTVTIKLNGKVVATNTAALTNSQTLVTATYTYKANQ